MVNSFSLTKVLKLLIAAMIAIPLAMATGASAQQTSRSVDLPKPAKVKPWQKKLNKSLRRPNPQRRLNKIRRSLRRDRGKSIGLPDHAKLKQPKKTTAPVTLDPAVSHLDIDGDGAISRSEYIQGRSRLSHLGIGPSRTNERRAQRLRSQFRRTDLNGDGKVTADELRYRGSGRF